MFLDASAIVAILANEPDATQLGAKLSVSSVRLTSAIAIFETVLAVARLNDVDVERARQVVDRFLHLAEIQIVDITRLEQEAALDAMSRYGKGRHPARLNMGDCFAYACAKTHAAPLLFKGGDFSKTDIAVA